VLADFTGTLEGALDLLRRLGPETIEMDKIESRLARVAASLDGVPTEKRAELAAVAAEHLKRSFKSRNLDDKALQTAEREPASQEAQVVLGILLALQEEEGAAIVGKSVEPGQLIGDFAREIGRPSLHIMLLRSLITTAVSALEDLMATLVTEYFTIRPEALRREEKEFSLADLARFASIKEAVAAAIEARVDQFTRKSFDEWSDWFGKWLDIQFSELAMDWRQLGEVLERRHTLVHSAGRATKRYVQKVGGKVKAGEILPLDSAYLEKSIDAFAVFGILLTALTWQRLLDDDEGAPNRAASAVYDFMRAGRWEAVEAICSKAGLMHMKRDLELVFRFNGWLAKKRLGRWSEVETDVRRCDVSGLAPRYQVVWLVLIEDFGGALERLPEVLRIGHDGGGISPGELYQWPILEELRRQDEFRIAIEA
jgi:hypothetical protein